MGQGPDIVMLHGWSMNSAVWHDLADLLSQHFTLHLVDLPGHGQSDWQDNALELDAVIEQLAQQCPQDAYWLGWSLGGGLATAFAHRFPSRVEKLILLAATPSFVQREQWQAAMDEVIFTAFADNLESNQADTLQRFLLLQARGSQHSRETIKRLSAQLAIENPPKKEALQAGLKLLIELDMRTELAQLTCPIKMILGERDTLIPKQVLKATQQLQARLETVLLKGAGHAPFISQPDECFNEIESFLND